MISLISENTPFPEINDSVFSLRQRAFFNSYGCDTAFFMTWVQTDEDGKETSAIASLSGDVTLSLTDEADFEEIEQFLSAIGFSSLFFNKRFADKFSFSAAETGEIMHLEKALPVCEINFTEPDYKAVFDLIFKDGEADFSDWFCDVSFRVRHKTAFIHTVKDSEKTAACALCLVSEKSALLTSVGTKKEYRNKGMGTKVVSELCSFLRKKGLDVFICIDNEKIKKFYSPIGFETCGEWMSVKNE